MTDAQIKRVNPQINLDNMQIKQLDAQINCFNPQINFCIEVKNPVFEQK
jgi:hypothetical protein